MEARRRFPPEVTARYLSGAIPAPEGLDGCLEGDLGTERLHSLRSGETPQGSENDLAATCLFALNIVVEPTDSVARPPGGVVGVPPTARLLRDGFSVSRPTTSYRPASSGGSVTIRSGEVADVVLGAVGLGEAGGSLLFNRPSGLSTDGRRLVMTDVFNNRVLIWNELPRGNVPPDVVLGQQDFSSNSPGTGRHQMNWPVSSATAAGRLVVTDTNNNRILVWNVFPTRNGQPADIVLSTSREGPKSDDVIGWPWGAWTDGSRLVTTSTNEGRILVWNNFPTRDGEPADIVLFGGGDIGTPRQVVSDGESLLVGDHNATGDGRQGPGTFIWHSFPDRADQPYDVFRRDPRDSNGPWLRGDFADDGRLVLMGGSLQVWAGMPESSADESELWVLGQSDQGGFDFTWSDFSTVAVADEMVYVTSGRNLILGFEQIPESSTAVPDFSIGAETVTDQPLLEHYFLGDPVPATDGTRLFVTSDFDKRLHVWHRIPDESGVPPDVVYHFCEYRDPTYPAVTTCIGDLAPWDNALHGDVFAAVGKRKAVVWEELPVDGAMPTREFQEGIGSVRFDDLRGVAVDDRYFYLADYEAGRVWVWAGLPGSTDEPVASLVVDSPQRMSSDGTHLAVSTQGTDPVIVYRVDEIEQGGSPVVVRSGIVRPQGVYVGGGQLVVADTPENQVEVWWTIDSALAGNPSDAVLGAPESTKTTPEIGADRLFMPSAVATDGRYLWIGEYKFSNRLLRFGPS